MISQVLQLQRITLKSKQKMHIIIVKYHQGCFKAYCGSLLFWGEFCCKNSTVATKIRHPRPEIGPFQGFSSWYFWIPGHDTKINKEKFFSTI